MTPSLAELIALRANAPAALFDGATYPWEALARVKEYCKTTVSGKRLGTIMPGAFVADNVDVGSGTVVEPGAVIFGPTIIGDDCEIRAGAYIRGDVYIGNDVVIGHSTEVKHAIVLDGGRLAHFNYVGDSVLGYNAHLSGGAILANTKLQPGEIAVKDAEGNVYPTGLQKFGAAMGDGAGVGCNAVLNPGAVIGKKSLVYPLVSWRGILPSMMVAKDTRTVEPRNEAL